MNLSKSLIFVLILSAPFSNLAFLQEQINALKHVVKNKDPYVNIGIYAISPGDNQYLYEKNIDRLFTPASNTKLFTAAAALSILGPEYCYCTKLVTDGCQDGNMLHGNVYLKAAGDPTLTMQNLENLFYGLKEKGIEIIDGNVCIDLTIFDDCQEEYFGRGYCVDDFGFLYNLPTTSLTIDRNIITDSNGNDLVINNPQEHVLSVVKCLLDKLEITCQENILICQSPNSKLEMVAQHCSKQLKDLVAHMLKVSDNLYANALFKTLGAYQSKSPGSWQNGKQAVKSFLKNAVGIEPTDIVIEDGAGLSLYNLITPRQVVQLLTWIYNQPELFEIFKDTLAISGTDGTLLNRLKDHPGIVKAKTGTLGSGVSALSGYILDSDHDPIIFSILINNFIQYQYENVEGINYKTDIEDKICSSIIEFVRG